MIGVSARRSERPGGRLTGIVEVLACHRHAFHFESSPRDDTSRLLHALLDNVEDVDPGVAARGLEESHRKAQDFGTALPRDNTHVTLVRPEPRQSVIDSCCHAPVPRPTAGVCRSHQHASRILGLRSNRKPFTKVCCKGRAPAPQPIKRSSRWWPS